MTDIQKTPFVRELASSDRKTRDKALDSLTTFLRARNDLTLLDLLKLWKGLFFCFYHSDRPLTQQSLARALSYSLVPTLPASTRRTFLQAFWITISRDFHALDRLRLDKYLFLIRCYVGVAFEVYLRPGNSSQEQDQDGGKKKRKRGGADSGNAKKKSKRGSDSGVTPGTDDSEEKYPGLASYISMLEQGPLYPLDFDPDQPPADDGAGGSVAIPHGPDGLRYHILDLWIDEIEKVVEFEEGEDGERRIKGDVPMEVLLRPVETLKAKGMHKPVRTRAGETLDDERLVEWGVREKKAESESDEDEWAGFDD